MAICTGMALLAELMTERKARFKAGWLADYLNCYLDGLKVGLLADWLVGRPDTWCLGVLIAG